MTRRSYDAGRLREPTDPVSELGDNEREVLDWLRWQYLKVPAFFDGCQDTVVLDFKEQVEAAINALDHLRLLASRGKSQP